MRVSTSLSSAYLVQDGRAGAGLMIERARAAWAAGLEGLYVGDHHATPVPYYQNSPILGRLAAEWPDRRFGALYLLPLWHPLVVAEQVGTLAALGTGRFVFQCAIGGGEDQFGPMGISLRERVRRFESALPAIRALLAGEEVDDPDGPWGMRQARISPIPGEPVEIWVGGAGRQGVGPGRPPGRHLVRRSGTDRPGGSREAGRATSATAPTRPASRCAGMSTSAPTKPMWTGWSSRWSARATGASICRRW